MNSIGIDMSKDTFHAALAEGYILKFMNTKEGIEEFMTVMENIFSPKDTRIGVEATGVYHLLLAVTLTEHSWDIVVINPLESHRFITKAAYCEDRPAGCRENPSHGGYWQRLPVY